MRALLRILAVVALTGAGCHRAAPVAAVARAAETYADNLLLLVVYLPNAGSFSLVAPQSTPPDQLVAQGRAAAAAQCAAPCRGLHFVLGLNYFNVNSPPPPGHAYAPELVNHYVDGAKTLVSYLDSSSLDAKSKRDSLQEVLTQESALRGHVLAVIAQFRDGKQQLIDEASQKIKDSAAATVGQEMTTLADIKQKTQMLQQITSDYAQAMAALAGAYSTVVAEYQAYRALEADSTKEVVQIAQSAATAGLDALAPLQLQLQELDSSESQLPEDLEVAIARITHQLTDAQESFDDRLAPYATFMTQQGFTTPDATSVPLASLSSMRDYCVAREDRMGKAVAQVAEGLSRRVTALIVQGVATATQPTLLQAAALQASAGFISDTNARLAHLWQTLPKSRVLELSFLSAKYDEMTSLLQLEPMCASAPPAYMQTGCNLLQSQFSRAHTWIRSTAPSVIRIQAQMMSSAGVDATKTAAIVAEVNGGQVRQAAFDQDLLLQATDLATPDGGVAEDE
ncbi:MAG TPA: hypothetical protein VHB97_19370 [Polyangia bacterium]|nr:hypothetical protein [Polyangia bacterium]